MRTADILFKVLGLSFFVYFIWIFMSGGVATAIKFSNVPWYAWASILLIVFIFVFNRKK